MEDKGIQETSFEYCGIRCTEHCLLEIDGGKVMVTAPRQELTRYRVLATWDASPASGSSRLSWASLLILYGLFPPHCFVIDWLRHGGTLILDLTGLVSFRWSPSESWLVFSALKRGHFLEVELQGKRSGWHSIPS